MTSVSSHAKTQCRPDHVIAESADSRSSSFTQAALFFAKKDQGAWTIPKGEYLKDEPPLEAAKREFQEETGFPALNPFLELGSITQKRRKDRHRMGLRGQLRSREDGQQSL
ncbi:MAG: NUDIX domain-containing protein [Edaphobacter sp.]